MPCDIGLVQMPYLPVSVSVTETTGGLGVRLVPGDLYGPMSGVVAGDAPCCVRIGGWLAGGAWCVVHTVPATWVDMDAGWAGAAIGGGPVMPWVPAARSVVTRTGVAMASGLRA